MVDEQRTSRVVVTQRAGTCAGCIGPIVIGDEIVSAPYFRWVHSGQGCREQLLARDFSAPRRQSQNPAYQVACPSCGVGVGDLCVTASGKKCPVHAARRDAAVIAETEQTDNSTSLGRHGS